MKKLVGLLLVALVVMACNKLPKDATVISGKVENAKELKDLKIKGEKDFSEVITLREDGTFADTLQPMETGRYVIRMGRAGFPVYLEAGDNLKIVIDLENKEKPITFSEGKAVAANNYIVAKEKLEDDKVAELGGTRAFFMLEEAKFLSALEGMVKENLKILEDSKLSEEFVATEKKTIEYEKLYNLSTYSKYHASLVKDKDYKPSEKITKPLEAVTYDNLEDYEKIPPYRRMVLGYFQGKFYEKNADKEAVVKEVKNSGIELLKKDFASFLVNTLSLGEQDLEGKIAQIKSLTTDKKVLESLEEFLVTADKLGQGKLSPTFAYKSIKGKEVKLEDLKGKLVYIDVWATWCGPCKGELPYLKKLEKEYHRKPIHFVSISVDNTEQPWRKMVKEKKLGGIQLHADKNWQSDFVQAYGIKGIPRFILLDKKGNIISADAPRPSSDEIRPLINKWLKRR